MVWHDCTTVTQKNNNMLTIRITCIILLANILLSCSTPEKRATLRDVDVVAKSQTQPKVFVKPKSDEEIRKAYADYLKYATKEDTSRLAAINRLAQLEFELNEKLLKEKEKNSKKEEFDETYANQRLDTTIELLSTSVRDYPKAKGNDRILYQLAKAYDQKGDYNHSEKILKKLVTQFPKSQHYIESQFRLGEIAFSRRKYADAEFAYTDIIGAKKDPVFYEKALFKRGWARFKQEYYLEAVDDYLAAVTYHDFKEYADLNQTETDQFKEYFRAIGLSFSYLGGAEPLNDYFKENSKFKYIFYTYSHVSDIYLKEKRYSDAVDTLNYYIKKYPDSKNIPDSHIKIIDIWKNSGFTKKASDAIETFYTKYNPQSKYWLSKNTDSKIYKKTSNALKGYIMTVASYYHGEYRKDHKHNSFNMAQTWYKRYLKHYSTHARKDKIYSQYAELLSDNRQYKLALANYELAAYDGDIILDKPSAYATIVLTKKLYYSKDKSVNKQQILNKHINYSLLYSQLYSSDKNTGTIIVHASELAYRSKQYAKAIEIASLISDTYNKNIVFKSSLIKAHSYFALGKFSSAEDAYNEAANNKTLNKKEKREIHDRIALSIYKQGTNEKNKGNVELALHHYLRIVNIAPASSIAATGLYDGIALAMKNSLWTISIDNIKKFQSYYPKHKYSQDLTKKLSVAYLKSDQGIKAAREFEKISGFGTNRDVAIAALWQASELYEEKNDYTSALKSYEKYVNKYKTPYPQYLEAMNKLVELNKKQKNYKNSVKWQYRIIKADKNTSKKLKTDRTMFIASAASLNLANSRRKSFDRYKLVAPLKRNLRLKKAAMQKAVKLFGRASVYGIPQMSTEATFAIADIYNDFSKALLVSERPKHLNKDELEQYEILLEDKAFPFEEKAIEFHEINMAHTKEGIYNDWIKKSYEQLKILFPVRYQRKAKLDGYINVLH